MLYLYHDDLEASLVFWFSLGLFLWIVFLVYDLRQRSQRPSLLYSLALFGHMWPAIVLYATSKAANLCEDPTFVWFIALLFFRYSRTVVNLWFYFRYRSAPRTLDLNLTAADCTIVLPTVGPNGNAVFAETLAGILVNQPHKLILSTNTAEAAKSVRHTLRTIIRAMKMGETVYQREWGLGTMKITTDIVVINADISSKRQQSVIAFEQVETSITVMADDTAIWHPRFLEASLPAFESGNVGFVGTRKWVKCLPRISDPSKSRLANLWKKYRDGFWNTMGALYLVRHNFEIRATNAADGGVFCVSGRTSLIRSRIITDPYFQYAFLNEFILQIGNRFSGFGPIIADDDNFLTRWVINHGWDVKIQHNDEATVVTTLGRYPRLIQQCQRWSRTTFRQNPIALFVDRTIWWKWPITVWTTYFPWMLNAALIWDPLIVLTLTQTNFYLQSEHRVRSLAMMIGFTFVTKLTKTAPWFWMYPGDFFLYFFPVPAYHLFAYFHSLVKVWTALTFWDVSWSGRNLK